jgi:HlyD family secretion protein
MLGKWVKRATGIGFVLAIVAATVYALMPPPVPVDIATIDRGPLEVTVDEEGMARVRDVYVVSSPIAGRLARIPVHVGDQVARDVTTVASIRPLDPSFLDTRSRHEIAALVEAARATVASSEAQLNAAEVNARVAQSDLERSQKLAATQTISAHALEKAVNDLDTAKAGVEQAKATLELRKSELASAQARLIEPDQQTGSASGDSCCVVARSPIDGVVLKLSAESEKVVLGGTPLVEVGDPRDVEIVTHLLSADAVNVAPGAAARLDEWGGPVLNAKVRQVEPAGYTKVSALGIEEQRVDTILDVTDPHDTWNRLGHAFRVMVHIAIWKADNVVRVPLGALFRRGNDWNVFRTVGGRALLTPVTIDHRNQRFAEVTRGLAEGERVVLHPSDRVTDGVALQVRDNSPT